MCIRDRPGDELRHLHWKATARTGQLMVREYVDPAQPWCVVVLDTRHDVLDAEAFEAAVEIVASVLWAAAEQDRPVRLAMTSGLVVDVRSGTTGLRAAADQLPPGVELDWFGDLKAIPPYDVDDDVEPAPHAVRELRAVSYTHLTLPTTPYV